MQPALKTNKQTKQTNKKTLDWPPFAVKVSTPWVATAQWVLGNAGKGLARGLPAETGHVCAGSKPLIIGDNLHSLPVGMFSTALVTVAWTWTRVSLQVQALCKH